MKRIISFLLALTMSFSIVMPSVAAAYESSDHASASVSDVSSPEGSETVQPEADAPGSSSAQQAVSSEESRDESPVRETPEASSHGVSEAAQAPEVVAPAEKTIRQKLKTVDGVKYTFTLTYSEDAQLPDNTELSIVEVNQALTDEEKALKENKNRPYDTETFISRKALEQEHFDLRQGLKVRDRDYLLFAKFLDLSLTSNGKKVQPKAPVEITLETNAVAEGASDALNVAVYDKEATKEWQKELEKLRKERKAKIKAGKVVEVEKREKEKVFQRLKVINQTEKDKGVKLSFQLEKFTRLGVAGVAKHLRSWKVQDETVTVYGPRGLKAKVSSEKMSAPEAGLEKVRAFSVKPNEKKNPKYDVTFWVGTQSKETEAAKDADSLAEDKTALSAQADEADEADDTGVVVSELKNGKARKELIGTEGADAPVAIEQGELVGLVWDTGLRSQSIEAENVSVEGLLPKKAEVSADDVLWRYSRPKQVNKKAGPEAETVAAYDITITGKNGDFQPEDGESVSVSIQNENISASKDLEVWHLKDDGTVEVIRDFQVEGDTISFDAAGFSVYMVVQVTKELVLTASDGKDYKITVNYDANAGIPEDAELAVSELEEGKEYDKYVKKAAKALDKEVRHLDFARAFDISLVNPRTKEHYQPTKDVKVSIQLLSEDVQEGDRIDVVHFGKEPEVLESGVNGETVEFKTDGFSVYVVAKEELLKHFVFLNDTDGNMTQSNRDDYVFAEQVLINGEDVVEPPMPFREGCVFDHWSLTDGGSAVDFNEYKNIQFTEENDQPVYFYAVYQSEKTVVTFYNQSGLVVQRVALERGKGKTLDTTEKKYSYTPIQDKDGTFLSFEHWTKNPSGVDFNGENGVGTINIDSDADSVKKGAINLYPVLGEGHYISFDSNRKSINNAKASYVPPLFVKNTARAAATNESEIVNNATNEANFITGIINGSDDAADTYRIEHCIPEAEGFTFAGWYTTPSPKAEDIAVFTPNGKGGLDCNVKALRSLLDNTGNLMRDRTLYAKWNPPTTAKYTVIIWKQKITDDKNAPDTSNDPNIPAKDYDFEKSIPDLTGTPGQEVSVPAEYMKDDRYPHFHLNTSKTQASTTLMPDGSTILNVYYDRDLVKINFTYRTFTRVSYPNNQEQYYDANGVPLARRRNDYYRMYSSKSYDSYYGWVTTNWINSRTVLYTQKIDDPRYIANNYDYPTTYYAKQHNSENDNFDWVKIQYDYYYGDCYKLNDRVETYSGLYGQPISKYYDGWPAGAWNPPTNDSIFWNYVTTAISEFKDDFTTVTTDPSADTIQVQYYFQNTDGSENTDYSRVPDDHAAFSKDLYTYSTAFNDLYTGMRCTKYKIGKGDWKSDTDSPARIILTDNTKVYFERISKQLTFHDPLRDTDVNKTILYGAPLGSGGIVTPEEEPGYSFKGWYYDEGGVSPVDFERDTMPAANKRIYAVWEKKKYPVKLIMNNGQFDGDQAVSFNVNYGEKINIGADPKRDFVKVTDGTGDYTYDEAAAQYEEAPNGNYKQRTGAYVFQGWYEPAYKDEDNDGKPDDPDDPYVTDANGNFPRDDNGEIIAQNKAFAFVNIPNRTVTLVAKWQRAGGFYVRYNVEDPNLPQNTSYATIQVPEDPEEYIEKANAVVLPAISAPKGYSLAFWTDKHWDPNAEGHESHEYLPNELVEIHEGVCEEKGDAMVLTLTAHYKPYTPSQRIMADYTFMTNVKGDGFEDSYHVYETERIAVNEELKSPITPPEPKGYIFKGWYYDKEGTRRFDGFGVIANPVYTTIYAVYEQVYTVNYYLTEVVEENGVKTQRATSTVIATQTYSASRNEALDTRRITHPVDLDHYAVSWVEGSWVNGKWQDSNPKTAYGYNSYNLSRPVKKDLNLRVELKERQYIKFDTHCDAHVDTQEVPVGGWPAEPDPVPVRKGYRFLGWYTEETDGEEYYFRGFLPNDANGKPIDTLHAHWKPDGTTKGNVVVIWWAQSAQGGNDYEYQATKTYKGAGAYGTDVTLDFIKKKCPNAAECNTDNLPQFTPDELKYGLEFNSDKTVSENKVNGKNPVIGDRDVVYNIYFDRKIYHIGFKTNGNGTVYYNGNKFSNKSDTEKSDDANEAFYFIEAWLGKDIEAEWPIVSEDRQKMAGYPKACVKMNGNKKFKQWTNESGGTSAATLQVVVDAQQLKGANSSLGKYTGNNVLVYALEESGTYDQKIEVHYILDGVEDVTLRQIIYNTPVTSNYTTYGYTTFKKDDRFNAKDIKGYDHITTADKRTQMSYDDNGSWMTAGFNEEEHEEYHAEYINGRFGSSTSYTYSRKPADQHTQYYYRARYNDYRKLSFNFPNSGGKNDYIISYQSGARTQRINSGYVYYVENGADPHDGLWGNTTRLTWADFISRAIKEDETSSGHSYDGKHYFSYYTVRKHNIHLMKKSGHEYRDISDVAYNTDVPEKIKDYQPGENNAPPKGITAPRGGMRFLGWTAAEGSTNIYTGRMPDADLILYPAWEDIVYNVTTLGVDQDGNGQDDVYQASYDQQLAHLGISNPAKEGKLFQGWQIVSSGEKRTDISMKYKVRKDITIAPKWYDLVERKVVYHRNFPSDLATNPAYAPFPDSQGTTWPDEGQWPKAPKDDNRYIVGTRAILKDASDLYIWRKDVDGHVYKATFSHWNTEPDGSGQSYYPNTAFVFQEGDTYPDENGHQQKNVLHLYAIYSEYRETELYYDKNADDAKFVQQSNTTTSYTTNLVNTDGDHHKGQVRVRLRDTQNSSWPDSFMKKPNDEFEVGEDDNSTPNKFTVTRTDSSDNRYVFAGWSTESDALSAIAQNGDKIYVNTIKGDDNKLHNTLYAVWGICKVKDQNNKEYVFSTLQSAVNFISNNGRYGGKQVGSITNSTGRIEMLVDYSMPQEAAVTIPGGCKVTLTTAAKDGKYRFIGHGSKSTIKRHYTGSSLFTVDGGTLTLENITLDGDKERYTCNSDGGLVYVKSGSLVINHADATLENSKANSHKGGAVYVKDGGTMTMSAGTINGNVANAGAGIYLEEGAALKLSGNPNFGGTDRKGGDDDHKDDLKGESGNFVLKDSSFKSGTSDPTNGGKAYPKDGDNYKVRQDIFIAGYIGRNDNHPKTADSLLVTGKITSDDGSIWVWAEKPNSDDEDNHYKQLKQFAKFDGDGTKLSDADKESSMKAFRNAQSDDVTGCNGEYLFGQFGIENTDDKTNIYWSGVNGYQKVILKKVGQTTSLMGEQYYEPLPNTQFEICDRSGNTYNWKDRKNPNSDPVLLNNLTTGASGTIWIGELAYGTYFLHEIRGASGYKGTNHWFYLIVYKGGVYQSGSQSATIDGQKIDQVGGYSSFEDAKYDAKLMDRHLRGN